MAMPSIESYKIKKNKKILPLNKLSLAFENNADPTRSSKINKIRSAKYFGCSCFFNTSMICFCRARILSSVSSVYS